MNASQDGEQEALQFKAKSDLKAVLPCCILDVFHDHLPLSLLSPSKFKLRLQLELQDHLDLFLYRAVYLHDSEDPW